MRLGRRDPDHVRVGDAVDFWRVEAVRRPKLLRLRAEMKVPGRAWLQYEVTADDRSSRVVQTAFFEPRGLSGLLYWYALLPAHLFIFRGSIRELVLRAERAAEQPGWRRGRARRLPTARVAVRLSCRVIAGGLKAARARSRPAQVDDGRRVGLAKTHAGRGRDVGRHLPGSMDVALRARPPARGPSGGPSPRRGRNASPGGPG